MCISLIAMGWRWHLFEPWWHLIPRTTHAVTKIKAINQWRRQTLLYVKGPDCRKVNLYRRIVESISKMRAETDKQVFTGWKSWSQRRWATVLSTAIQEAVLGKSIKFPSRRAKTLSQVEVAFIWKQSSKSERCCCGIWFGMESAWRASQQKRWNWKWDRELAIGLDFPLTEEAVKEIKWRAAKRNRYRTKDMMVGALEVPHSRIFTTEQLSDRTLTRLEAHRGPRR